MKIALFFEKLRESGIEIRAEKGKLICNAPKGAITPELAKEITQRKPEIIAFLGQISNNKWSSLVAIQPEGTLLPFFCFHGVGGNVLNYSVLVPYLGPDQPLYGLQSQGLDGITQPFQKIEPMAEHYINEIKTIQPNGPYYFGGGSMGGVVALEAAQQLQKQGEKIGILVMFDTLGPNYGSSKFGRLISRVRDHNMLKTLSYAKDVISEYLEDKKKMAICLECQQRGEPIPHNLRFWFIEQMNYMAMNSYEFSIYDGEITLLKGSDEKEGLFSVPDRGWGGMTTQGLKIYNIPGHHDYLVEQPFLGQHLAKCLKQEHNSE